MKLDLADIATDEKKKLQGFKILGLFPFYLRYIKTGTHIQLCKLREQIQSLLDGREPSKSDFHDSRLQEKLVPCINTYIVTALVNNRSFSWLFTILLNRKLKTCGHYHILNLYMTILKLDQPAFFLSYWNLINQKDNTLLKEVEPSLAESSNTKKKPE